MKTDMKRTKIKFLAMLLTLFIVAVSCTDNFREYNTNPHESTVPVPGALLVRMQRNAIPIEDEGANEYQRAQNLTGDVFSGYMGAIGGWNSGSNNTTYDLGFDKWNDVAFEVAFSKLMPAWKQIFILVEDREYSTIFQFAQVLKVFGMHRVADNYGPLPYLQFGHGGVTTPYDTQEEVYKSFFSDLDEAIEYMTDFEEKNPTARPWKDYDLIYDGDYSKWAKFANSLKLRLAMRIVYVAPDLARKYAEEAVAAGVIEDNADNANVVAGKGFSAFHALKKCWDDYSDTRMGANMESFLKGYNDARMSKYFRPSTLPDGGYHGVRNGIKITSKDVYKPLSVPNIEADKPIQWMCAAEIYLLRAEGAIRGWDMQGTAQELYEKGVEASFAQWGATIGNYLADETSKPAPFVDVVGSNSIPEGDNRLSTITIAWKDTDSFERKLERIITQKWLAMFPEGQEAWTEFRRTGYPKVFPVAVNNSRGTINTDIQIRRITFPQAEYNNNEKEVRKAAVLLGGPDTGGTKLWWDKK